MITIIRNDHEMKFCHDVSGIKIKEEKPEYQIIAILHNEGLPIFKSCDYEEVARTFDIIVNAIVSGESYIMIEPPKNRIMRGPDPHDPFNPNCSNVLDIDDCECHDHHKHHHHKDELNMFSPNHFRENYNDINNWHEDKEWDGHYSPDDWNRPNYITKTNLTFNN